MVYFTEDQNGKFLCHFGILGQKWGIRRYQNPDGTLTEAGKKRDRKIREGRLRLRESQKEGGLALTDREIKKEMKRISKPDYIKSLSDKELEEHINRLKLEDEFRDLTGIGVNKGKKTVGSMFKQGIGEGVKEGTKNMLSTAGRKIVEELFGNNQNNNQNNNDNNNQNNNNNQNQQRKKKKH